LRDSTETELEEQKMKHTIYLSRNSSYLDEFYLKLPIDQRLRCPEMGLHPVEFARLIPELLTQKSSTHIITHSETLINYIGYMIFHGKYNAEDFLVQILNDNEDTTVCVYDQKGYLVNWPYGFFSFHEVVEQSLQND
jgi:hypothetical protein